jgi:hypothetical protein
MGSKRRNSKRKSRKVTPVATTANLDSEIPTPEEQFVRISSTTLGGALFGGAAASAAGFSVMPFAMILGGVGLGISGYAAYVTITGKDRKQKSPRSVQHIRYAKPK